MTIQHPPNDETPPVVSPSGPPNEPADEPEQRAPGERRAPMGAPRDEPDPDHPG